MVRYLVLALFLILSVPSVILARGNVNSQRPASGTVVITGKDGKVTGVEQQPGSRSQDRNRNQNQNQNQNRNQNRNNNGNGNNGNRQQQ